MKNTIAIELSSDMEELRAVIVEQPAKKHRFRYQSEVGPGHSVDVLLGAQSSRNYRSYPTIEVPGYDGPLSIMVCLINARDRQVNPHALMSSDPRYLCSRGVLSLLARGPRVVFKDIGVVCVRKKNAGDVRNAFRQLELANIDPFRMGWEPPQVIDADAVRLCFNVYLPGPDFDATRPEDPKQYTRPLRPLLSSVVRRDSGLTIVQVSACAGSVAGGTEMFLCCKPYKGRNPEVVFRRGSWQESAAVTLRHRACTLAFTTPPYRDPHCRRPVTVEIFLRRRVTGGEDESEEYEESDPVARELAPRPPPAGAPPRRLRSDYFPSLLSKPTLAQSVARRRAAPPAPPAPPHPTERMDEDRASTSTAPQAHTAPQFPNYTVSNPFVMWEAHAHDTLATNFPLASSSNAPQVVPSWNFMIPPNTLSPPSAFAVPGASTASPAVDVLMSPGILDGGSSCGPPYPGHAPPNVTDYSIPLQSLNLPSDMSAAPNIPTSEDMNYFELDGNVIPIHEIYSAACEMMMNETDVLNQFKF